MSETTHLLNSSNDIYCRFSPSKKKAIVGIIAWAAFIDPFASETFVPCIAEIAKILGTTEEVINYTVGLYSMITSLGILIWGRYSEIYGRRPIYLTSLPLFCVGALVSAFAQDVVQLAIGRAIQAFGAASASSVGAGVIGDIYRLEVRGTAMGIYLAGVLLAPALAPISGGFTATYASWRTMQFILFGMSLLALLLVAFVLPETSHPNSRVIDKIRERDGSEIGSKSWQAWTVYNPFKSLGLLRGLNVTSIALVTSSALLTDSVLLIPMSYTMGLAYGIRKPVFIGACFLPAGMGNLLGALIIGRISDKIVIAARKRRKGYWMPEDRLLPALPPALLLVPVSVLVFGTSIQYIPGTAGFIICLVCLFMSGIGVTAVIGTCETYMVDVLHARSAEAVGVNASFRMAVAGLTSAFVLPAMYKLGVAATGAIAAALAWLGFLTLFVTIHYGSRLRAWVDIGYSVKED